MFGLRMGVRVCVFDCQNEKVTRRSRSARRPSGLGRLAMPTRTSAFVDGDDFELGSRPAQAEKTFADVLDKLPAIDWDKPDDDAIHDDGVPPPVVLLPHDVAAESDANGQKGQARIRTFG